jgi:2-phospho-L-lactate guanylyltransferase
VSWTVIIPVKRLEVAKSRLRGTLPGVDLQALVLAMALDTVAAALASPVVGRVLVVTPDAAATAAALALGATTVADVPDAGLNPALAYAAAQTRRTAPASPPGVAALAADLPALRTAELTAALTAAATGAGGGSPGRSFVSDAAGTGTVLLAAAPGVELEPCFGAGSAAAHAATGALALAGDWPSLRRDVDTAAELAAAVVLGLGPRTGAVAAHLSAPHPTVGV